MMLIVPPSNAWLCSVMTLSRERAAVLTNKLLIEPLKRNSRVLGRPPTYSMLNWGGEGEEGSCAVLWYVNR